MRSATAPEVPKRSADGIANRDSLTGDRGFESFSLQRGVMYEPALTLFAMTSRTRLGQVCPGRASRVRT